MSAVLDSPRPLAPDRSLAQRMDALDKANWTRTERANLKRDLKAGRQSVVPLILDPPEWLETMKVGELLLATPKYGRVRVGKVLRGTWPEDAISPSRPLGGLSSRQRERLAGLLR